MKNSKDFDVIVVGAGNAALCSAISAHNEGAKVLILEKAPRERRSGNCCFAGGGMAFWHKGLPEIVELLPQLTKDEIDCMIVPENTADGWYNKIMEVTEERADPNLAEVLVSQSNPTVRWLREQGLEFEPHIIGSTVREGNKLRWKPQHTVINAKGGGKGLSDSLFAIADGKGIETRYLTKAVQILCNSGGRVHGVKVKDKEGFRDITSKAVVLACGGFESNREWRARYLGPGWDLVRPRGTCFNTGDGLRMALEIGAQPAGHWSGRHATAIDYWQSRVPEGQDVGGIDDKRDMYHLCIQVNTNGQRFVDEGADFKTFIYAKYGAYLLEQPLGMAWQIFDAKVAPLLTEGYPNGTPITADTIQELAEKISVPALPRTIAEFNASVKENVPLNFAIRDGRGTVGITPPKSNWAQKIDTPPFLAYGVGCGISYTFGGLKINTQAQVIDGEGEVIPGLYTTGEMLGGIWYKTYTGGGGIALGAVFGRIAGANAAGE
ncbi:MAG: FAD-dependent tricarballylate dehydrogenase TcuA [Chloroflexi bacterium]|nr:FAD-dependent tricarballylate dehydrogenase TcuA [Chloroflexota bacterium]